MTSLLNRLRRDVELFLSFLAFETSSLPVARYGKTRTLMILNFG